jgi:hypothetical protein
MIRLLLRLRSASDSVAATFCDLDGHPQESAARLWSRLEYLERSGVVSCRLHAAGEVARHPSLPSDLRRELMLLVGIDLAERALDREGVPL